LDRKITGENRELLLEQFLNNSQVYVENNEGLGYYIPDLKEGLIVADFDYAGIELMKLKYSKINVAGLPSANHAAIEFLLSNGFVDLNKKGTRMIWGKDLNWKPEKIYSRIGGNLG
jgi:hypothetical protein